MINLNNSSPAAIASTVNVTFQKDSSGNVSACLAAPQITAFDVVSSNSNIGLSNLVNSGGNAGYYKISAYIICTSPGSVSSTMPSVTIGWTDKDSAVAQTSQIIATNAGNTTTTFVSASLNINVASSAPITVQTAGYASSAAGMTYSLHIRVEFMNS